MDRDGWVSLSDLTLALERFDVGEVLWSSESVARLLSASNANARFQITVNRCRATCGHSCSQFHPRETGTPDVPLYHGTSVAAWQSIAHIGLMPMGRKFVQLTSDLGYATAVAANHSTSPAIVQIATTAALDAGVKFYATDTHVWLATSIPAESLQLWLNHGDVPFDDRQF